jgi:hypothetical protein
MEALKQPTIRVIAIIAKGVPQANAKKLIAYACAQQQGTQRLFISVKNAPSALYTMTYLYHQPTFALNVGD